MQLYANSIVLFCYTSTILYYLAISISRSYCLHSNKEVSFWLHEANRIYYLNGPVYQNIFITLFSLLKFDIFNLLWIQKKIIFDYMKLFEFIPWMRVYRSIFLNFIGYSLLQWFPQMGLYTHILFVIKTVMIHIWYLWFCFYSSSCTSLTKSNLLITKDNFNCKHSKRHFKLTNHNNKNTAALTKIKLN